MRISINILFLLFTMCLISSSLLAQNVPKTKKQIDKEKLEKLKKETPEIVETAEERVKRMINNTEVKAKGKAKGKEINATAVSNNDQTAQPQQSKSNANKADVKNKKSKKAKSKLQPNVAASRKDFGQARANEAKNKKIATQNSLKSSINSGKSMADTAKTKVATAKKQLEQDKRDNKISDEDYLKKKSIIDRIEEEISNLEEKLTTGKKQLKV